MTNNNSDSVDLKRRGSELLNSNRLEEAKSLFASYLSDHPEDAEAWYLLSSVNGRLGDLEAAGECSHRAIELRPDYGEAHINMGNVLFSKGQYDEALNHYQTALQINPQHAMAHGSLANLYQTLGRYDEAVSSYLNAIRLDPNLTEVYYNLGNLMRSQKSYDEAQRYYREAIRRHPGFVLAYYNLATTYYEMGDTDLAARAFRHVIGLNPTNANAHNQLAIVLKEQGHLDEARDAAESALRLDPALAEAHITLADVYIKQAQLSKAMEMLDKALATHPDRARVQSHILMTMHYISGYTKDDLFDAAKDWDVRMNLQSLALPTTDVTRDPHRRLRVGYVSADLWQHPVGYFIEPVFANYDREQFEFFCYYNNSKQDDQTKRLQEKVDHWYSIVGKTDEEVACQIHGDRIDILVDLAGHTAGNRLGAFIHKPAPVQVSWLGYYDTTGLSSVDYIIADRFVIPDDERHLFVEQVVHLPHSYLSFAEPHYSVEVSAPPAASTGKITFGCFNNPNKITPIVIAVWSELLRMLPEACLRLKFQWFQDEAVCRQYRALFAEHGADPAQIVLSGHSPRGDLLDEYRNVDIALDPFPYNGGTTTLEALWMGVPVISLKGDRFVARVGETILQAVDLEEFVADTNKAYVEKALALAGDLPRLEALRMELRDRLVNSPICDGPGFTRTVEAEFRRMWTRWCTDQPVTSTE